MNVSEHFFRLILSLLVIGLFGYFFWLWVELSQLKSHQMAIPTTQSAMPIKTASSLDWLSSLQQAYPQVEIEKTNTQWIVKSSSTSEKNWLDFIYFLQHSLAQSNALHNLQECSFNAVSQTIHSRCWINVTP